MRALEIQATGPLALVQDLGRPGLAGIGVSGSGAADRGSLRLANRLVANPEGAAGIEVLLGGLAVRALADVVVALTGAPAPASVDGRSVPHLTVLTLPAGRTLVLGTPTAGLRTYVAVRGGAAVSPVLGSRSTDTLSGLGPEPLRAGSVLPIGEVPDAFPVTEVAPSRPLAAGPVKLRATPGPRQDWLADLGQLTDARWCVSPRSDRVGIRLEGGVIGRSVAFARRELPSEGLVRGAIQIPPSGGPVIFGPDHPTTGGYPVVAVLNAPDADLAAQLRPGQEVKIRLSSPQTN